VTIHLQLATSALGLINSSESDLPSFVQDFEQFGDEKVLVCTAATLELMKMAVLSMFGFTPILSVFSFPKQLQVQFQSLKKKVQNFTSSTPMNCW
jgi:hypothetical protein